MKIRRNPINRAIFYLRYEFKDGKVKRRPFENQPKLAEAIEQDKQKRIKVSSLLSHSLRSVDEDEWCKMPETLKQDIIRVVSEKLGPKGASLFKEHLNAAILLTVNMRALSKTVFRTRTKERKPYLVDARL